MRERMTLARVATPSRPSMDAMQQVLHAVLHRLGTYESEINQEQDISRSVMRTASAGDSRPYAVGRRTVRGRARGIRVVAIYRRYRLYHSTSRMGSHGCAADLSGCRRDTVSVRTLRLSLHASSTASGCRPSGLYYP